jgi:hypothetical protein
LPPAAEIIIPAAEKGGRVVDAPAIKECRAIKRNQNEAFQQKPVSFFQKWVHD